jgi:transcriptional regulator with XRE-family HTH domain
MCNWTRTKRIFMVMYMAEPASWPVQRFRATLERILDETGLPQAGLAALVPIDQSQLSRWKSGTSRPKFDSLKELGEALRARYPSLQIGPNELLESAGYAPPEPVAHISQVEIQTPVPPETGVHVEQFNNGHLRVDVTIDTQVTMDEAIASLGDLSPHEQGTIAMLRDMRYEPAEVAGAILLLRGLDARRSAQLGTDRRKA